jgi:hypothetical protein
VCAAATEVFKGTIGRNSFGEHRFKVAGHHPRGCRFTGYRFAMPLMLGLAQQLRTV